MFTQCKIVYTDVDGFINERLEKRGKGGVEVRRKRLFVLAYVDIVLLAIEEGGLRLMIEEFRKYVKEKGLEVNTKNPR